MGDSLIQSEAQVKVLEYKLSRIRNYIESRINIVDSITKKELQMILDIIKTYENVPPGWQLSKPLVDNNLEEDNN